MAAACRHDDLLQIASSTPDAPPTATRAALERVERTLTDGYAQALALEAERSRLERADRRGRRASSSGDRRPEGDELSALAARLALRTTTLDPLRGILEPLCCTLARARRELAGRGSEH